MGIIFRETKLKGAFVIEPQEFKDERGFLTRSFSQKEFEEHGLNPRMAECNISFSKNCYTIRGMHFQKPPLAQAKLVRCTKGAILRCDNRFAAWILQHSNNGSAKS